MTELQEKVIQQLEESYGWSGIKEDSFMVQELFKDVVNATNDVINKVALSQPIIERFEPWQKVQWGSFDYWVIEDNGEDKVLVANFRSTQHPEYNDWWVERGLLNAI